MANDDQQHMSWCEGTHRRDGACRIVHQIRGGHENQLAVVMDGLPCGNNLFIEITNTLIDLGDLDEVVKALGALRPAFEASQFENECD